MEQTKLSHEEVRDRGMALYETQIRDKVETEENIDKICVIDVLSGDYEIDKHGLTADDRLRARQPSGQFWGERIGYEVAYSFGPIMRRRQK